MSMPLNALTISNELQSKSSLSVDERTKKKKSTKSLEDHIYCHSVFNVEVCLSWSVKQKCTTAILESRNHIEFNSSE